MVDLKHLAHLVALADECHFARAAERVHLSQPAFSRSIQAIESEVGMRLFDRHSGDVKPTPAGLFFVERARRLLFDARSLHRDVSLYRESELGDTAFGAGPYAAATIMPRAMIELRRRYPRVGLRLETNNWQLLLERLLAEDVEFFVADTRDLPADPQIHVTPIGHQSAHLFARKGHPLAGRTCKFADAWSFGVAATKVPVPIKQQLARLLGLAHGTLPVFALECDDMALLRRVALSTDTVFGAPDVGVAEEVKAGSLVQLKVKDLPAVHAQMGVVTLVNRTPSPMAQQAITCIRKVAASVNS